MKTILDMAEPLGGLLKDQQPREGEPYRLMHYVVSCLVGEGLLLYHVMTKALVLLDADEARGVEKDPASVPGMVAKWFAVPLSHDDRKLALEVRSVGRMLVKPVKAINSYTILTTTDCNARCFYCYEKGRSRIPMSDATARETAAFIIRNSHGEKVHLRWFGGEPLYNKEVITTICGLLAGAGVPYKSTMVSNGFLFDDATVAESVQSWNLKKVQVTLDGTEGTYNRIKNYVEPDGSPFLRVLGNIRRIADAGVRVTIRLNIDRHNADDLFSLVEMLGSEFGNNPLVGVYSHSLFEACAPGAAVHHSEGQRKELYDKQILLRERLRELGLSRPAKLRHSLKLNRCMADNDAAVVIMPDGHIGKCEHFTDSEWFAHVGEGDRDESVLSSFKELRPDLEACADCPVYPDCFRLAKCLETVHCYPDEREEKLALIRQQVLSFYQSHEAQD